VKSHFKVGIGKPRRGQFLRSQYQRPALLTQAILGESGDQLRVFRSDRRFKTLDRTGATQLAFSPQRPGRIDITARTAIE